MHVRILFANPSHNANSVTEFDFPWSANANANFVLLILRIISQPECPGWCLYGSAEERVVVMSWECNELKIWPKALSQYLVLKF